ncbi:hypothetical protein SPAN111604_00635 [Sphingomonas antarctica]
MPRRIGWEGSGRGAADPPAGPGGAGFGHGIGADEQRLNPRAFGGEGQSAGRGEVERRAPAPKFDQHQSETAAAQAVDRCLEHGFRVGRSDEDQLRGIDAQIDQARAVHAAALPLGTIVAHPQDRFWRGIGEQGKGAGACGLIVVRRKLVQRRLDERRGDAIAWPGWVRNVIGRGRKCPRRRDGRVNHSSWFVLVWRVPSQSQAAGCVPDFWPHVLHPGSLGRRTVRSEGARPSTRCNLPA